MYNYEDIQNFIDYYTCIRDYAILLIDGIFGEEEKINGVPTKIKNPSAIKLAFVSNILLYIKENVIKQTGYKKYESKLLFNSLEKSISLIAKKEKDKYIVDNYSFNSSEEILAMIRNKFGHGEYRIDFDKKEVVFLLDKEQVRVKIDLLADVVVSTLSKTIADSKGDEYKRRFICYSEFEPKRKEKIKEEELENILVSCESMQFIIKTKDGKDVPKIYRTQLEKLIEEYKNANNKYKFNVIKKAKAFYNSKDISFSYEVTKLNKYRYVNELKQTCINSILNNKHNTYYAELALIINEIEKVYYPNANEIKMLTSNVDSIITLNELENKEKIDLLSLSNEIAKKYHKQYVIGLEALVSSFISMYTALYIIPFDKYYKNKNYHNGLDFSKLTIEYFDVIVDNKDNVILRNKKETLESKKNKLIELDEKINIQKENYNKITKEKSKEKLNNIIEELETYKTLLVEEIKLLNEELNEKDNFYENEELYFKNLHIIEGIRDSIAHGNYYIEYKDTIGQARIVFEDIYENELIFKCKVNAIDFFNMLESNYEALNEFYNEYLENKTTKNK